MMVLTTVLRVVIGIAAAWGFLYVVTVSPFRMPDIWGSWGHSLPSIISTVFVVTVAVALGVARMLDLKRQSSLKRDAVFALVLSLIAVASLFAIALYQLYHIAVL